MALSSYHRRWMITRRVLQYGCLIEICSVPERGFQAVLGAVANAPGTLCDAELLEMGDVPQLLLSQGYQKG